MRGYVYQDKARQKVIALRAELKAALSHPSETFNHSFEMNTSCMGVSPFTKIEATRQTLGLPSESISTYFPDTSLNFHQRHPHLLLDHSGNRDCSSNQDNSHHYPGAPSDSDTDFEICQAGWSNPLDSITTIFNPSKTLIKLTAQDLPPIPSPALLRKDDCSAQKSFAEVVSVGLHPDQESSSNIFDDDLFRLDSKSRDHLKYDRNEFGNGQSMWTNSRLGSSENYQFSLGTPENERDFIIDLALDNERPERLELGKDKNDGNRSVRRRKRGQ